MLWFVGQSLADALWLQSFSLRHEDSITGHGVYVICLLWKPFPQCSNSDWQEWFLQLFQGRHRFFSPSHTLICCRIVRDISEAQIGSWTICKPVERVWKWRWKRSFQEPPALWLREPHETAGQVNWPSLIKHGDMEWWKRLRENLTKWASEKNSRKLFDKCRILLDKQLFSPLTLCCPLTVRHDADQNALCSKAKPTEGFFSPFLSLSEKPTHFLRCMQKWPNITINVLTSQIHTGIHYDQ